MSFILVEVDPGEILVDESRFQPDQMEPAVIYEHLLYACSKASLIPGITIQIENDAAFVIQGHWYPSIARDLKASRIRAIIDNKSNSEAVQRFLRRSSVTLLDWEEAKKDENKLSIEYRWLIFFFERPLTESDKRAFELQVVAFYRSLKLPSWFEAENERVIDLAYSHRGACAEFQAFAAFADESWYAASRATLERFHREVVPVVSFQGYKLEF
jgi:hypothetical protein